MGEAPTVALVEDRWTVEAITERCRVLRGTLHARRVPDADLDALAPGGSRNQVVDPLGAAITWFVLLRERFAVAEHERAREAARADAALAAALVNAPVPVRLSLEGRWAVYPKSYHALRWCDALDGAVRDVVATLEATPDAELAAFAHLNESLAVRLWAWILTCREPGLPFDEGTPGDPPDWTQQLTPEDLVALVQAHLEVNRTRIQLIAQLFPPERAAESRLSLSGFLGTVAQELGHRPSDVLTRWSLGEAFAQAVVASQSAQEARARTEAEAAERAARRQGAA